MTTSQSLADQAYTRLRSDLIACRIKPGERLTITALQDQHQLSQAAIREALSRLSSEGLVLIERNRGFRATPVSAEGFRDLVQTTLAIEIPALRLSIENGDREWELNLVATYHRALRTLELVVAGQEPVDAYATERLAFYEALLAGCRNPWMLWTWRLLYTQHMRYRHLYVPLARYELELNPQHERVLKAVLTRDVEAAVAFAVASYDMITKFVEKTIDDGKTVNGPKTRRATRAPLKRTATRRRASTPA